MIKKGKKKKRPNLALGKAAVAVCAAVAKASVGYPNVMTTVTIATERRCCLTTITATFPGLVSNVTKKKKKSRG